jgi:hypothetical protein
MAIATGNVSSTSANPLTNTTVVPLCTVPSGPCTVTISNVSGATVYVGPGTGAGGATPPASIAALANGGFAIPTGAPPVPLSNLQKSGAVPLFVTAATAPTAGAPVSWAIST